MDYIFHLNDVECEEPIGWADFELSMKRDDVYHGMQFLASTGSLRFWGNGAAYLRTQKNANGIGANVTFKAEATCDETFDEVISGRLNFGKYKDTCGDFCIVEIPFEEDSCTVTLNSRFDNKVDLDSIIAADTITVMPVYNQLGPLMPIPAKALQASVDGSVGTQGNQNTVTFTVPPGTTSQAVYMRPDYLVERYNNIATGQLTGGNICEGVGPGGINLSDCNGPITPQLLFEDTTINCFDGVFDYSTRQKGRIWWGSGIDLLDVKHRLIRWDGIGNIFDNGEVVTENTIYHNETPGAPQPVEFDDTIAGTVIIPDGIGFYSVIMTTFILTSNTDAYTNINYDAESTFTITAKKLCPPSFAQRYMIHEALSRAAESITNGCVRVKSEYYGRIDSQPFSFDEDGCGGLRMVTSGLKLRAAPDGKIFASLKDLISGLNAIDNIGFNIDDDPDYVGRSIMRVEPVEFFYNDAQLLQLDAIPQVSNEIQEGLHYAKISVGYKKWEVQEVNGLNEFNSNREYRTNVDTINTSLDITSAFIAGSYPIEVTRLQSFAESGAADTTYDNDIFLLCLERAAYDFIVEENKILNPVNIYDPATVKNYRISPLRNLMRWFKSIINTYANINTSASKIFFNAGTGNFLASGTLDDSSACRLENSLTVIQENGNLGIANFADQTKATPIFKNEYASFEYPLSLAQWKQLRTNPYGYIAYTCGTSATIEKGFIKEVKYRPAKGMANFTLRKKWGQ